MERNATSSTSAIELENKVKMRCFWTFRVGGQLKEPLGECSPESDASKADISMQRNGSSIALLHVFSKRLSVELMPTFSLSLSVAHVDHPDFIHGASFFHRMNERTNTGSEVDDWASNDAVQNRLVMEEGILLLSQQIVE